MKMLLGEAYCLRAYRYFLLCNFWGDVPYFTQAAKAGMQLDVPKTDKNIIYSGCTQDLVDCEEDMYFADEFADGIERMNREFAIGMIARLALFRAG
jgi:starch-binding outer membrane protein, SusD/RagB family